MVEEEQRLLLVASAFLDDVLSNRHVAFVPTESHVKIYRNYKRRSFEFLVSSTTLSIFLELSVCMSRRAV